MPPLKCFCMLFARTVSCHKLSGGIPCWRRRIRYIEPVVRLLASILALSLFASQPVQFAKRILADDLKGGYQVIACDVNGDGKQDLIALASDMPDLVWFENPTWKRHVMAAKLPGMINAACWTRSPHTIPAVAVAYEFSMHPKDSLGIVSLLTADGDPRKPWKATEIDRLPASHRLRWADIDGSGNKVLINAPLANADAHAPDHSGLERLVPPMPNQPGGVSPPEKVAQVLLVFGSPVQYSA